MQCPNCKRRVPDIAETCKCGWTREAAKRAGFVHCHTSDCPNCAVANVKTETGDKNFCPKCYEEYFTQQASIFAGSRGLDTKEKQANFCKTTIAGMRQRIAA